MLQLSSGFYNASTKSIVRATQRCVAYHTSYSKAAVSNINQKTKEDSQNYAQKAKLLSKQKMQLQSLQADLQSSTECSHFVKKIQTLKNLDDLLNLAVMPDLPAKINIEILSIITNWINGGGLDTSQITNDTRFQKLQENINKDDQTCETSQKVNLNELDQLSTSKMILMIKEYAVSGKRPTPILNRLSNNIVKFSDTLPIGDCTLLLRSLMTLNFPHQELLKKICRDLVCQKNQIKNNKITHLMVPLGMLRYKNIQYLESICSHILNNRTEITPKMWLCILQTLATVGYVSDTSDSIIQRCTQQLTPQSFMNIKEVIDFVWSMLVLGVCQASYIENLNCCLEGLDEESIDIGRRMKLLNICAAAETMNLKVNCSENVYSSVHNALKTSQPQDVVNKLNETLTEVLQSHSNFAVNVNSKMGFFLAAECFMNASFEPVPIYAVDNEKHAELVRIAIVYHPYKDYCIGVPDLLGSVKLRNRLLIGKGYRVLNISYQNFGPSDNLLKRATYMKTCFENLKNELST